MERESSKVYDHLLQAQSATPCFFLHVLPDLKEQQFDFIAHFPCYSVSPSLQFTVNDPAKGDFALELDDFGQSELPTALLQNRIACEYYRLFHALRERAEVRLPHSARLELTLRQTRFTLRHLLVSLPFPQLVHAPPAVYENGFTAESSRGHRIVEWNGESTTVQREAMVFNLQLMKWRLFPSLEIALLSGLRVLLLGAGTLGCAVARTLVGWGVHDITFVDSGVVSPSNPTRQCLYSWKEAMGRNRMKATLAAEELKAINPAINSHGVVFEIPMPDHVVQGVMEKEEMERVVAEKVNRLCDLIDTHDVVFLLTDSRESRWLPSLLCCLARKLCINIALGGDSFLIQRYGLDPQVYAKEGLKQAKSLHTLLSGECVMEEDYLKRDSCYFCSDILSPTDSLTDRSLDQLCTTTRIGLTYAASGLAVELLVNFLHNKGKSTLGVAPNQIRMNLADFKLTPYTTPSFSNCTCCCQSIQKWCFEGGTQFIARCIINTNYIQEASRISAACKCSGTSPIMEIESSVC